jgi:N-acetyltransferase 10
VSLLAEAEFQLINYILKGKSVAIGMATASAVLMGFSNIYITAPSPENLVAYFEFLVKSLETLGLKENQNFDVI